MRASGYCHGLRLLYSNAVSYTQISGILLSFIMLARAWLSIHAPTKSSNERYFKITVNPSLCCDTSN